MPQNPYTASANAYLARYQQVLATPMYERLHLGHQFVTDAESLRAFQGQVDTEAMAASVEQDAEVLGVATAYNEVGNE